MKNQVLKTHQTHKSKFNRKYKDRLFCHIFGNAKFKKYALALYNAINNTDYKNPDDLEIYTIEDVVYMKMKNDVAYLIANYIALYEHQSTINPNMPIRGFIYFAELYGNYIEDNKYNIYSKKLIKLPTPQYIVFYNGEDDYPPIQNLRLSDSFINPIEKGNFEWTATVININKGKNDTLRNNCQPLDDYMFFVEKVRLYSYNMSIKDAVDKAYKDCLDADILPDIFLPNENEVRKMILTEFNEKKYKKALKAELKEECKEEYEQTIYKLENKIADKDATIADKDATIADKDATIAELKELLKKNTSAK